VTRIAFLVTHLMGAGHLVRTLALARAAEAAGAAVLVISGGRPLPQLGPPGVPVAPLPPVTADGLDYRRLLDAGGRPATDTLRAERIAAALAALGRFRPDWLVTETWPFGRGALAAEFAAAAAAARAGGARLAVSIRDIPEPPSRPAKARRAAEALADFDLILAHGDPALAAFGDHWPLPEGAAAKLRQTGYVAEPLPPPLPSREVLVAVGGGVIGRPLLRLAAGAAALSPRPWRLLVGGADAAGFAATLPGPAVAEPARADYRARLAGAAASVSLAGYNTVADLLRCGTPAVVVPMAEGGEREQLLRGAALARRGLPVLAIEGLAPPALAGAVERAIAAGPRPPSGIATDGAARSAAILLGQE
jgi:predicted glycosyltransferase